MKQRDIINGNDPKAYSINWSHFNYCRRYIPFGLHLVRENAVAESDKVALRIDLQYETNLRFATTSEQAMALLKISWTLLVSYNTNLNLEW